MFRKYSLEILLALAMLSLVAQAAWPGVVQWWQRPAPGRTGFDSSEPPEGIARRYAMHLPVDYFEKSQPWPLIVFLHGSGETGNDVERLYEFKYVAERGLPAIVAAPQCLPPGGWEPDSVVAFIDRVAANHRVDPARIYLVGPSMGGYGTWHTATAYPDRFAAIVPICGGGEPQKAGPLRDLPTWAFHGKLDEAIPVAESERMFEAIRAAGGNPQLTVLADAGHAICDVVCGRDDLWTWLLSQQLLPQKHH
jgi:predicted peptidase